MEWTTVLLILGIIALLGILLIGGHFKITREGLEVDTEGYLNNSRKAGQQKGEPPLDQQQERRYGEESKRRASELGRKVPRAWILWVDDHLLNNFYERQALAHLGIFADSYTTNGEALEALSLASWDLVVSDIGRDNSEETGWDLLKAVRSSKPTIPFVFYTSKVTEELSTDARAMGAAGIADRPRELMDLVLRVLPKRNRAGN